jgi:tetratricopeptide (TPR) repeat protein
MDVWINGTPFAQLDGQQIPHIDQWVSFFKIKKGWHQLTLRTQSDEEHSILGFYARMTTISGDPVPSSGDWHKKKRSKPGSLKKGAGETSLMEYARQAGDRNVAGIMLQKEIDKLEETPKALLLKAFAVNPERWVVEKLIHLEETPNKQWEFLSAFLKKHPEDPWGLSQKGSIALSQSRYWEARKYSQRVIARHPGYWEAHLLENNTLSQMNLYGEALRRNEKLRDQYGDIPWLIMDLCDLYDEIGLDHKMFKTLDEIYQIRHVSQKFNARRIRYLSNRDKTEELSEFYRELIPQNPDKLSLFLDYTEFLRANDQKAQAERLLLEKTHSFPENPYLLESLGQVQMELHRKQALTTFEKILKITPQNPKIEKMIQMYHSEDNLFYSPYVLEGSTNPELTAHEGVVMNIHNTVVKISPSGLVSEFTQIEYEIVDEKGVKNLLGHSFSYSPLRQQAEILKSEIQRKDQTILFSNYRRSRLSNPNYKTYYDLVAWQIPFPTLKVGDRVLLEYRVDDVGQNIFGSYYGDLVYFQEAYPVGLMKYTLILPQTLPFHYQVKNMVPQYRATGSDQQMVHQWTLKAVPIMETEPLMPPPQPQIPYLTYSRFESWDEMAEWYHNLVKEQLRLDQETRQIVMSLKGDLTDHRAIVQKIHEYVITHTRYVALEFGIHGYKPYQVNKVCSRQFGDCKDKASLMAAMLREAGIGASIAIVRTTDKGLIDRDLPNLRLFNHAITYVPELDIFLDGTAEYSGMDELPGMDQGALTFIIDEQGKGTLGEIPIHSPNQNMRETTLKLSMGEGGKTRVSAEMAYTGSRAPTMRRYLDGEGDAEKAISQLGTYLIPGFELTGDFSSLSDLNEPVRLTFNGESGQVLMENQSALPLDLLAQELLPSLAPTAQRNFPLWLEVPEQNITTLTLRAPGKTFSDIPENLALNTPWFLTSITFETPEPGVLNISYSQTFPVTKVPVDKYPEFRSALNEHDRLLKKSIHIQ